MNNLRVHLVLIAIALIYALTFIIAKEVMPVYVGPFAFIFMRVSITCALLWIFKNTLVKNPRTLERMDVPGILICAIFGVALNMLLFFKGLSLSSAINASVIMITTPLFVLLFALFLKAEKPKIEKYLGIALGTTGALLLIFSAGKELSGNSSLGNFLVMLNAISYALYLVYVKRFVGKYSPITITRWMFTFAIPLILPFSFGELQAIEWQQIPAVAWWQIAFVIIGATFIAYVGNAWALKRVESSVVGAYIYLQPLLTSILALLLGKDILTKEKIVFSLMIFTGVFLVSFGTKIRVWVLGKFA